MSNFRYYCPILETSFWFWTLMSNFYFQMHVMYHFFVLTTFWRYLWSITEQEKQKEEGNVHLSSQLCQQKKRNQLQKYLMSSLLIWVGLSGKKCALGLDCFPMPKAGGSNQGLRSNFFLYRPTGIYFNYHFKDAVTIMPPPHTHTNTHTPYCLSISVTGFDGMVHGEEWPWWGTYQ